ncbi:MAG: hypothetical protein HYT15_00010 [Candidatus Magasanikbacteria bacterium]|nr:hypothetical protein [Candidatus Magasanikbacteria bacterium]
MTGFIIKLNKPAPGDIVFSWLALAVKDAKIVLSTSTPINITPEVIAASSTTASSTASANNEPDSRQAEVAPPPVTIDVITSTVSTSSESLELTNSEESAPVELDIATSSP